MEKKTVGILTHWIIPNYGAFLQAYALRNVIEELYSDYDVRQIAYMNNTHSKMYYGFEMHELYKAWFINPSFYRDVYNRLRNAKKIINARKFKNYYRNEIKHTVEYNKKSLKKASFDTLVLGSDILWDYSIDFYNKDEFVFGNGINSANKVSYAASFGTVQRNNSYPEYVIEGIKALNAISVRDSNSSMIIRDIKKHDPPILADPTLLWDFKNDKNIPDISVGKPYAVVYGGGFSDEQIEVVKNICKENELMIVQLESSGDDCPWCDLVIEENRITPFEWCSYIKNSEVLITSAFHGLMFGLIFEKKILFNPTEFMIVKAEWIIRYLGLDVLMADKTFLDQMELKWDYQDIKERIDKLKKKSISYLKSVIY